MLAPPPPARATPAAAELTKLLEDFLAGASRNDAAMHDRFWAEDLIYTGSAGRRVGKADILKDVRSAPAPSPVTRIPRSATRASSGPTRRASACRGRNFSTRSARES